MKVSFQPQSRSFVAPVLSRFSRSCFFIAVILGLPAASTTTAAPWVPIANPINPFPGRYVPGPGEVPGKDFSDVRDRDDVGLADPEQDVAFDGSGGVRNSFDYSGSRVAYPDVLQDGQVDGIAAGGDALFQEVRNNQAALLFSVETDPTIMFERATGVPGWPSGFGVWATAPDLDVTVPPLDTDGLEVWGGDNADDSDRYSLAGDPFTNFAVTGQSLKVAVWAYDPTAHDSVHHTLTMDLADAMDRQFFGIGIGGPLWSQLVEIMDVDAIMTFGEAVTFSIRPIDFADPLLPDFDGGEIFEYDGVGSTTRFLDHGGHLWNTAFDVMGTFGLNHENIDALEAVSAVPEPGSIALLLLSMAGCASLLRRR